MANKVQKKALKKQKESKFTIDCSKATAEGVYDLAAFEKFLHDRIKVQGRTGNLGDAIKISKSGDSIVVVVAPGTRMPKRYLKYLTKKFLKKNLLRDAIKVIATDKTGYQLAWLFNPNEEEADE